MGPLIFCEPEWGDTGSVTGATYRQHIVSVLHAFTKKYAELFPKLPEPIIIKDGAAAHRAHETLRMHEKAGFIKMVWPPRSPDLNPIENLWRLLKWRVGRRFPTTSEQVRAAVEAEWAKLCVSDFQKYCQSMPERITAVIAAQGGHTKW